VVQTPPAAAAAATPPAVARAADPAPPSPAPAAPAATPPAAAGDDPLPSAADEPDEPSPRASASNVLAAAAPRGYTPARLAGIIGGVCIEVFLIGFLIWAFTEKAKMRSAR
jgi:hypothetical protein